jgi:hypothetical protein
MIGIAAMLSTASAINATLYGSARLTYTIAKSRSCLPEWERRIWNEPLEGSFITRFYDRAREPAGPGEHLHDGERRISHRLCRRERGRGQDSERESSGWVSIVAAVVCAGALAALISRSSPAGDSFLAAMILLSFGIEAAFSWASGRTLLAGD